MWILFRHHGGEIKFHIEDGGYLNFAREALEAKYIEIWERIDHNETMIDMVKGQIKYLLSNFGLDTDNSINLPWSEDFQVNPNHFGPEIIEAFWSSIQADKQKGDLI